jgi:hypothetical protein
MSESEKSELFWRQMNTQADEAARKNPVVEIWRNDAFTLDALVTAISRDRRLSWMIVSAWLTDNHKLLIDNPG